MKFPMVKKRRDQQGFTMIELIIYLAIVSVILVSISYLILDIIGSQSKSDAQQEVNQQLRFLVDVISKDIRAANDITNLSADTITLQSGGLPLTYTFDGATQGLSRQVGSGLAVELHSDEVLVTGSFSDFSYLNRAKAVGVQLEVSYKNPDDLPDRRASSAVNFTLELRGRR